MQLEGVGQQLHHKVVDGSAAAPHAVGEPETKDEILKPGLKHSKMRRRDETMKKKKIFEDLNQPKLPFYLLLKAKKHTNEKRNPTQTETERQTIPHPTQKTPQPINFQVQRIEPPPPL